VHVLGDASATTQPKAGHIANQEAKVCADALVRIFAGGAPDPAPVTNSACYSTITMNKASWLTRCSSTTPPPPR
jgi:sulfide dehydrogenase [flavocytochrome c] flavoprotein subunit